jgi:hypothetical protein
MVTSGSATTILNDEEVQSKITATLRFIDGTFNTLVQKMFKPEVKNQIYINRYILLNLVESYYCDLYRLTHFRGITADHHKQAAFLIKWIIMLRPIQIHADTVDPSIEILLANEFLAVAVGIIIVLRNVHIKQIIIKENKYIANLVYLLHYHSCYSPEQLASELYQFEQNSTQGY